MWSIIFIALGASLAINLVLFLVAFNRQSDKLTDLSYALSFLAIDITSFLYAGKTDLFSWIIFALPALWAVRIGCFLLIRILKFGSDSRFDDIRTSFLRFGKFWLGQAVTAWILMLPVSLALYRGGKISSLLIAGVAIWLCGLLIETIADNQKFAFKLDRKNDGKWIQGGLWKYARHPNYFGEILVWCGIYVACFTSLSTVEKLVCLASPILISLLLLFVSGVPLLEKSADQRWGNRKDYQDYKRRSRLLIPLPK
jgi:steroid 5-alpha reductase family enzyme